MAAAPLLSIGMIFKNEERCIERCLRSLQPLRDAIPCELVMADTGAEDQSRKIAERYADMVFDFPWIDDFSAARNAVMDRCSGEWYLSIDCDEWLDVDVSEILNFLQIKTSVNFAFVVVRNYHSQSLEKSEDFSDFHAMRLVRMSTGKRYSGAIHEYLGYYEPVERLTHTILHHDGYIYTSPEARKEKTNRNLKLLRQILEQQPENLRALNQCIESGGQDPDFLSFVRRAVAVVQGKRDQWQTLGSCVMRHAVETASAYELPELQEWIEYAEQQFPDSIFVQVDVNRTAFVVAYRAREWEKAIRYGEAYRRGLCKLQDKPVSKKIIQELSLSILHAENQASMRTLLIGLADAYNQNGQPEKALALLTTLNGETLDTKQVRNTVIALSQLHAQSKIETSAALITFYHQISRNTPSDLEQRSRLAAFHTIAATAFTEAYRKEEQTHSGYHRPAYTAFACLADKCEAGRGAKIMMTADPAEMREWLLKVEDWQALPIEALEHALAAGVSFPLAEKPLPMEVLDGLAAKLTHDGNTARKLALALPEDAEFENLQSLCWAQALALAALRSFDWTLGKSSAPVSRFACPAKPQKEDKPSEKPVDTPEIGLALIRRFAALESAALPLLYAPALLSEGNSALLPPMHRWGLTCTRALQALDAGRPQEYLAILRKGLAACPGEKDMVQFLLDRFMEDARPKASPELLALAEKIRAILAAYNPEDPAVQAIRESPAYKQVAWLIEDEANSGIPVQ